MKFDKYIALLQEELTPDGLGGFTVSGVGIIGTINAFITPVTAEIMLKEHGIVTTRAMKVFTKDNIPDAQFQLHYENTSYEVLQFADYGKLRMLLVQEIEGESY